jgi:hypothetical protein
MKSSTLLALALSGVALSGCATVIKGTTQSVAITTPPVTGANCVLTSSEGSWSVVTPGAVTVSKSKHDINVRCSKPGYQDATAAIPSDFQGWTLGNIILGGIIGIGVDAASGAMNEYPNAFQVPMTMSGGAAPLPDNAPPTTGKPTT